MNNNEDLIKNVDTLLQNSANQLAIKHQQRLHQMTRQAVYGSKKRSGINLLKLAKVVVPVFTVTAIALIVNLSSNQFDTNMSDQVAFKEKVPEWVKDTQVPLQVLENIAFYEWLAQDLKGGKHA